MESPLDIGGLPSQKEETLRSKPVSVMDRFRRSRLEWVIFAGTAAFCYGSDRQITDVDVLVKCEDLLRAKEVLKGADLEGFDIGCGAEIKTEQGICLFLLDEEMLERRS